MTSTPSTLGRAMADRDAREAVRVLLASMDASAAAQARVTAALPPDEAAFLAAKRARLVELCDRLGGVQRSGTARGGQ